MKNNILIASLLGTGLLLAACSSNNNTNPVNETKTSETTKATFDKDYVVTAINTDIQTVDFHKTSRDYMVPLNVFDRLVDVEIIEGGSSKLVPSLAKEWSISEDGKEYTIKLNEGIKFHNGNDFKANDVLYSFTRLVNVDGAVNSDFVSQIEGFEALSKGETDTFSGIEIVDDYTIKIKLTEAYAGFMSSLASAPTSILDEETTKEAGDKFGIDPSVTVGTGAYKLREWTLNDKIVLDKNENYFKGEVANKGVVIRVIPDTETQNIMFRNKELDILDMDYMIDYIKTYQEEFANNMTSIPRVGITYFTFNEDIAPFDNVNVRKAVSMAINRQEIVDTIYNGVASVENGIFPRGLIGYNENIEKIEYNPELAKEILKAEGFESGFDMEIALDSSSSDTTVSVLEVISAQLQEIGINANVKTYDKATWLETRKAGTLGSFMSTWSADYNDPDNFISTFFGSAENTKLRSINYKDIAVMDRVKAARSIVNQEDRIKEYNELEKKIVTEDRAWTPMFAREHYYALADDISGFVPNWAGLSDIEFKTVKKTN